MKQHTCTKAQLSKFIWPAVWAVVRGQQDHDGQLSPIPPAKLRLIIDPWSVPSPLVRPGSSDTRNVIIIIT